MMPGVEEGEEEEEEEDAHDEGAPVKGDDSGSSGDSGVRVSLEKAIDPHWDAAAWSAEQEVAIMRAFITLPSAILN